MKGIFKAPYASLSASFVLLLFLCGCSRPAVEREPLFERMTGDRTGIRFNNTLLPTEEMNTYVFRNFYNGGGVAIGDVDNDGDRDIFLTGNQVSNRLYLNRGDFVFEDVTETAGLSSEAVWTTGVSLADVNGDGWLDVYICKSGSPGGERRHNELFINDKDGTFTDRAKEYGVAVYGLSIHASFFDYDVDGDLDMYLLSNPIRSLDDLRREPGMREIHDPDGGNRLFRNEQVPHPSINRTDSGSNSADPVRPFTDVTEEAGIYSSSIGFGLGVSVADVNRDGWPDIYVSNDFFERDYLYLNRRDGSFEEVLPGLVREISLSAMGGDIADVNNDGYPEIFVSDMLPGAVDRFQSKISFSTWEETVAEVADGYHHQFTRNTLQFNMGFASAAGASAEASPRPVYFSEVGRLAGIEATGWSWGGLFADFDLDGRRDLFVPNGIYKDLLDQDFITRVSDAETLRSIVQRSDEPILELLEGVPSHPLVNAMFAGGPNLRFSNVSAAWGLQEPTFSNGAAFGDLDGDGDLDLVVNNVNMEAFVYRNRAVERFSERSWLQIELEGRRPNAFAVGAQLTAWSGGRQWYVEQQPIRGFQSTVDPVLSLGFGEALSSAALDSLVVRWPDGSVDRLVDVAVNQKLLLHQH